jgi:2-methylfumaryl-CoA isomerase
VVDGILRGLRVIEVSAFVAAPLAGATLASLGADVLRIEQLGGGMDARRWPLHEGRSLYRAGLDRGKRSIGLDLRSAAGQELAADLVTQPGDDGGILVTNLPARGWMAHDRLAERRPDLVMVVIEGTPEGGAAVDYTVNAGIGFPWVTGPEGLPGPVNHVLPAWDVATGMLTAAAVLAAERHRRLSGQGQVVRLALSDVAIAVAGHLGYLAEAAKVEEPRQRFGNELYGTYGRDFRTLDGRFVMVSALTGRQWTALADATGLADQFRALEANHSVDLADEGARFELRHEISSLVEPWIATRNLDELKESFDSHGVLWGPYRTFKELLLQEPRASNLAASPIRFASHPPQPAPSTSDIGADTEAVLREMLGLGDEAIANLKTAGVIR